MSEYKTYFVPGKLYELIGSFSFDKSKYVPYKSKLVFLYSKTRKEVFTGAMFGDDEFNSCDVVDLYFLHEHQIICAKGTSVSFNSWQNKFKLI